MRMYTRICLYICVYIYVYIVTGRFSVKRQADCANFSDCSADLFSLVLVCIVATVAFILSMEMRAD